MQFNQPAMKPFYVLFFVLISWSMATGQWLEIHQRFLDSLFVCGESRITIQLKNSSNQNLQQQVLLCEFPSGVEYIAGSVVRAAEKNILNLSKPIFDMTDLDVGQSVEIEIKVRILCNIFQQVNGGQLFQNRFEVKHSLGNDTLRTDPPYRIETGFLVITPVRDTISEAGNSIQRHIQITNTRLGPIHKFIFEDVHDSIRMSASLGTLLYQDDKKIQMLLDGSHFVQLGDRDSLFERGETIVITENIQDYSCQAKTILSAFSAAWGCEGMICQMDHDATAIRFLTPSGEAQLQFISDVVSNACPCVPEGFPFQLEIFNQGTRRADSIMVELYTEHPVTTTEMSGFLLDSFRIIGGAVLDSIQSVDNASGMFCEDLSRAEAVRIFIRSIEPGQRITLHGRIALSSDFNGNQFPYYYGYRYVTSCKNTVTRRAVPIERLVPVNGMQAPIHSLRTSSNQNLVQGNFTFFDSIRIQKPLNKETLYVDWAIPCGIQLMDSSFVLGGKIPRSIIIERNDATLVHLAYDPPFESRIYLLSAGMQVDCNAPCLNSLNIASQRFITSCTENKSDTVSMTGLICSEVSFHCYDSNGCFCGPRARALFGFGVVCNNGSTRFDSIPAYVQFQTKVERHNIYEADENGDRIADGTGKANPNSIQGQRFITQDTLVNSFHGIIVSDVNGFALDSISFLLAHNLVLEPLHANVRYFQQSTNRWFDFQMDSFAVHYGSSSDNIVCGRIGLKRESYGSGSAMPITLELLHEFFPMDTFPAFRNGDQFSIEAHYVFLGNVNDRIFNTAVTNYIQAFSRSNSFLLPYSCHEETHLLSFATLGLNVQMPSAEVTYCNQRLIMDPLIIQGNKTLVDFFSKEFRSLMVFDSIKYFTPAGISLDTLWVKSYYFDNIASQQVAVHFFLPQKRGNVYYFDKSILEGIQWDEAHRLEFIPHFYVERCEYLQQGSVPINFQYVVSATPNNVFWLNPDLQTLRKQLNITSGLLYHIMNPGSALKFQQNELYITSKSIQWDMLYPANDAGGYLKFELSSRLRRVSDFGVQTSPSVPVQEIRPGCFVLGPLLKDTSYLFHMRGLEESCLQDTLMVKSLWSCNEEALKSGRDSCLQSHVSIPVIPAAPELEMDIHESTAQQMLCDTLREISIDLFNANKGAAYFPTITLQIPQGVVLLPTTMWISYPLGAPEVPLPPPQQVAGNTYVWPFHQWFPSIALNGLQGVQNDPFNALKIRFRAWIDCGFHPGQYFIFTATGMNNCNESTNTLRKAGEVIRVAGIVDKPSSKLDLDVQAASCRDKQTTVRVTIWPQEMSGANDSCLLRFPKPLKYLENSFLPIRNIHSQVPAVVNRVDEWEVRCKLSQGVTKDSPIIFSVVLDHLDSFPCGNAFIEVESYTRTEAYCKQTQTFCPIRTAVSIDKDTLFREGASVELQQLSMQIVENGLVNCSWQMSARNLKHVDEDRLCLGVFIDRGTIGLWEQVDSLIGTIKFDIQQGQDSLNGLFVKKLKLPKGLGCNYLMGVINAGCMCSADTVFATLPQTSSIIQSDTLCFGDSIWLTNGLDSSSWFQWLKVPGACSQCFHQWYVHDTQSGSVDSFQLTVFYGDSCQQNYLYHLVLLDPPLGQYHLEEYCKGESVELNAGSHKRFIWVGKEITDPAQYVQRITLHEARTYYLHFEDQHGCKGVDTFDLFFVDDSARYFINPDTTILQGDVAQLYTNPGYSYEWTPSKDLSCSDCAFPLAKPDKTTRYQLVLTDSSGCKHILSVLVKVLITNCEQIELGIPNAFSPNGDRINDYFRIQGNVSLEDFHLIVVSRWGETVFEAFDPYQSWDGRYKGKSLPPDVYGYYLQFDCNGKKIFRKGNLSLLN